MTGPARDEKADGTNPSSVAKPVGGPTRKGNLSNGEDGPTESASNPRADHPSPAPPAETPMEVAPWCVCHAFPNPHRHDSATGQIIHEIVMRAERRVAPKEGGGA